MASGKNVFKEKRFHDEDAARAWFEAARWPEGPVCPSCGSLKRYANKSKAGVYRCGEKECRKDYTVMTKSVMERSHAKLTQWAAAFHLYAASKKGFTATQLERHLSCEYNTAWFLHHRVMEAMRRGGLSASPMGGPGKAVEVDEAYHGQVREKRVSRSGATAPTSARPVALATSALSFRLSIAKLAMCAHSMSRPPMQRQSPRSCATTCIARADRIPTKAGFMLASAKSLPRTKPSIMPPRNTPVVM